MTTVPPTPVAETGVPATAGSLAAVPRLLRGDPVLAVLIGAADATVAVPEAAQAVVAAALAAFTRAQPAAGRHRHRPRRRAAGRRPVLPDRTGRRRSGELDGRRRRARRPGHRAAGLGDPAVRAGQSRDRDDGPPPGGAARAERDIRSGPPGPTTCHRRPGAGHPAAAGPAGRDGAHRHPPGPAGRCGRAPGRAGRPGLPARAPGRAPRRIRRARRHRRRLPLHGRRARPHRPVG